MRKTPDQIAEQIANLRALKPVGMHAARVRARIQLKIKTLEGGEKSADYGPEDWEELDEETQDEILSVEAWMRGESEDDLHSGESVFCEGAEN